MIYRVHLNDDADGSVGYVHYGNGKSADARLREWQAESPDTRKSADVEAVATPRTKVEMLALLNRWAGHPDNG